MNKPLFIYRSYAQSLKLRTSQPNFFNFLEILKICLPSPAYLFIFYRLYKRLL